MQTVHIVGAGAMGRLWASLLTERGYQVEFIVKHNHPWLESGVNLTRQPDQYTVNATANATPTTINNLIIATKAYDASNAISLLKPHLSKNSNVLLLQNGMGSQQRIRDQFIDLSIYACSSTDGAYIVDQSNFVYAGKGHRLIGPLTNKATVESLSQWIPIDLFEWQADILPVLWRKLMINAAINPLTVLFNCKNGDLLKLPEAKNTMQLICHELDTATSLQGFQLEKSFDLAEQVCQGTSENYSSMYQDIASNRQTEIEFITGYVIQICQSLNVNSVENQRVYNAIKNIELHK